MSVAGKPTQVYADLCLRCAGEREHFAHICTPTRKQGYELGSEHGAQTEESLIFSPYCWVFSVARQPMACLSPGLMFPVILPVTPQAGALSLLM